MYRNCRCATCLVGENHKHCRCSIMYSTPYRIVCTAPNSRTRILKQTFQTQNVMIEACFSKILRRLPCPRYIHSLFVLCRCRDSQLGLNDGAGYVGLAGLLRCGGVIGYCVWKCGGYSAFFLIIDTLTGSNIPFAPIVLLRSIVICFFFCVSHSAPSAPSARHLTGFVWSFAVLPTSYYGLSYMQRIFSHIGIANTVELVQQKKRENSSGRTYYPTLTGQDQGGDYE